MRRSVLHALLTVSGIIAALGDRVRVVGDRAGMHLVVILPRGADDHAIALAAARAGISVIPLSSCYAGRPRQPGLVLGYGAVRLSEIPDGVARLRAALRGLGKGHRP